MKRTSTFQKKVTVVARVGKIKMDLASLTASCFGMAADNFGADGTA